jgi:EAL domain-containing protein (putative c-di-GMP-specific phosphodiesterase class I)
VLEITESSIVEGTAALDSLHRLKHLGVRLALDDFGTGYSSLSYLSRMPVDGIKIDKSFTDDVPGGQNSALLAGVLALAGRIGLETVIEGVEHQDQVRDLIVMGAKFAQCYLFDKPLTAAELTVRLDSSDEARARVERQLVSGATR